MSGIDERIVEMSFKGAAFASGVAQAINSLKNLKSGLNSLKGSEGDINNLDAAGKRFSLKGMSDGVQSIAGHFKTLSIVGVTAIATIANRAVNAGISMVKALTIDPIKAGLESYETKINAIQTIVANTASEGTTLKQVTSALSNLNTYANLTVYNFGEMARSIGTFTAAGVGLKASVSAIKGIANLAALSGSNAQQAQSAMYQLSQALAAGKVRLQDWNSVVNAGIGGKVFQNALVATARASGVAIDSIIKQQGGFRNSLQKNWLTSKILTQTLAVFTGDLSAAQLKAMGYTAQEAKLLASQGQTALKSATQVRTVSALFQDLKEEVATAWASVFQAIIGNIGQATTTLSALHQTLENALTGPIYAFSKILQSFTNLGGRALVIQAFINAFKALGAVLGVVGAAFREVFPSNGGAAAQGLIAMATALKAFTQKLEPSKQTLADLKTIFVGLFSAVKIVIDVIKALLGGLTQIGGASKQAGGGFLAFLAMIAGFITSVRKAIESGTLLETIFKTLGSIIAFPVRIIGSLIGALGGAGGALNKAAGGLTGFVQKVGDLFRNLATAIGHGITSGNFSAVSSLLNHLLVGSILLTIKNFLKGFGKASGGGAGIFAGIKESLEGLTNTLKVMQDKLKSDILEKIAIAVGILAASLLVLSFINIGNLTKALSAITVMMTELLASMTVVTKVGASTGIVKMAVIAAALNLLATALLILTASVAILAQFSWEQLAKGLSSIAILLAELVGATLLMSTDSKGILTASVAMVAMGVALNLMALAVGRLGKLDLGSLVKGVGSIAVLLVLLAGFNAYGGEALIGTATALVLVGVALNVIARAVGTLGALPLGTLAKGVLGVGAALIVIAAAMNLMPPSMIATALGLLVVSAALVILSSALAKMGGMSGGDIAKSLIVLAASLVIISAAMLLMEGALPGAAALIVVAAALAVLTPVLLALGAMSWEAIAKGLLALAGVFLVISAAGILLTPLVPTLLGLGAAILLLGAGVLAAGAGIALFAVGLAALGAAVAVSGAAIYSFVKSLLGLIPLALKEVADGMVAFAAVIGRGGVAITSAFVALLTAILKGIIKVVPLAAQAFGDVLSAMLSAVNRYAPRIITTFLNLILRVLDGIARYYPRFVSAGINLLVNMINGITRQIPRVAGAATNAVIAFINAIGYNTGRVVAAGIRMVINLINGIANQLRGSSGALNAAARNLGSAIIQGTISGIVGGISGVVSAAVNMAQSALSSALHFLHIHSPSGVFRDQVGAQIPAGTALGIKDSTGLVTDQVEAMGTAALATIKNTLAGLSDTVNGGLDLQPRITPVIDLTAAKKGFGDLSDMSKKQLIAATVSTTSAMAISSASSAAAKAAGLISAGGPNLTFNQYNTSPEPLSPITIYRRTKNQLSVAKGALASANSS